MPRFRSNALSITAASLSVLLIAGCPNAGTAPPLPENAKFPSPAAGAASPATAGSPVATSASPGAAGTTATPAATASTAAGGTTTKTPAPGATATPVLASAPPASGKKTVIQGDIFNEEGGVVDGATIKIRSLDKVQAYNESFIATGGRYVANAVPVGVQLEITATKENWTSRTRVASFQEQSVVANTVNFGGPIKNTVDAAGSAFFISDYPEIISASPGVVPFLGEKLVLKVKLSEPLDSDNRSIFENAFQISAAAAPGTTAKIILNKDSVASNAKIRAVITWNETGSEMTYAFNAPLRANKSDDKAYTFKVTRNSGTKLITDKNNKALGGPDEPAFETEYQEPVKLAKLSLTSGGDNPTAKQRWADTHTIAAGFDVKRDEVKPILNSVLTSLIQLNIGGTSRAYQHIELTFSEAMRVYPDATGADASVKEITNYVFALSDSDLNGDDLERPITAATSLAAAATLAAADASLATEAAKVKATLSGHLPFKFAGARSDVFIKHSDDDPKVVTIDIPDGMLPANDAKVLRVKVLNAVKDPAGNFISEVNKDPITLLSDSLKEGLI